MITSCPVKGRFLEAILQRDRAKAGRTGAPRNGRRLGGQGGAPGGAAPYVTGRARALPREVGTLIPPPRVPAGALAPPAAPPPRAGSRGTGKPRTHCAARMRKCGCLNRRSIEARRLTSPRSSRGEVGAHVGCVRAQAGGRHTPSVAEVCDGADHAPSLALLRRHPKPPRGLRRRPACDGDDERCDALRANPTPQPRSTSRIRRSRPAGSWSIPTIASPTTATGSTPPRSGWRRG